MQLTVARNHKAVVDHGKRRLSWQGILPLPDIQNASPRLSPQGNTAFETGGRNRPPKSRILNATGHSAKRSLFKGRHHLDGFAHVVSILYLVNAIARFR